MISFLCACLICINLNKYIHTLIKHIFDGCPSHTYMFTLLLLSVYWVLDIVGRR